MKKILLLISMIVGTFPMTFAQSPIEVVKSVSYGDVIATDKAIYTGATAINANNESFVAGVFDKAFTIKTQLEPISVSSFVAKYDSDLTPMWSVAIQGAATVTTIAEDGNGGVYVAGTMADEVVFNGTDGASITKEGMKMEGAFTTGQNVSFIAHYNAAGVVQKVSTIIPEQLPALVATGMYFPADGDLYFRIGKLEVANGTVYASAVYTGEITSTSGTKYSGGYMDVYGFMFLDLRAGAVFALDNDLAIKNAAFEVHPKSGDAKQQEVRNFTFTTNGTEMYVGFVALGEENYSAFNTTGNLSFTFTDEGVTALGHVVAKLDLATSTLNKLEKWEYVTDETLDIDKMLYMKVANDNLLIAGTYLGSLPFDNNVKATSSDDIYAVALNPNDLSVKWTYTSGYDEGAKTDKEEIFTAATYCDGAFLISGYAATKAGHVIDNAIRIEVDPKTGASLSIAKATNVTYSMAAQDKYFVSASSESPAMSSFIVELWKNTSGVESVIGNTNKVTIYPNPATEVLNFTELCDVEILSLSGSMLAKANGVTSIEVSSLQQGLYIARIVNDGKVEMVKFIKK